MTTETDREMQEMAVSENHKAFKKMEPQYGLHYAGQWALIQNKEIVLILSTFRDACVVGHYLFDETNKRWSVQEFYAEPVYVYGHTHINTR